MKRSRFASWLDKESIFTEYLRYDENDGFAPTNKELIIATIAFLAFLLLCGILEGIQFA